MVATIAPWFSPCLPSSGPGFESQAHHYDFSIHNVEIETAFDDGMRKRQNKAKRGWDWPIFFIKTKIDLVTLGPDG